MTCTIYECFEYRIDLQFLTGNLVHFSRGTCSHTSLSRKRTSGIKPRSCKSGNCFTNAKTGTTCLSEHCFTGTSLQIVLVCDLAQSADLSLLISPPEVSFIVDLFHLLNLGLDLLGASMGTSKHSSTSSSQQLCITLHSSVCSL